MYKLIDLRYSTNLHCLSRVDIVLNRLVQFNVIRHYVETNLFPYYS